MPLGQFPDTLVIDCLIFTKLSFCWKFCQTFTPLAAGQLIFDGNYKVVQWVKEHPSNNQSWRNRIYI